MKQDDEFVPNPKLRFQEFRGVYGWTTRTLGSVATINTKKVGNKKCIPMSITSGIGLTSQLEKFGRIIAGSSYSNYLLLKKNDFAYNKSATKEYPEGFIALYSGDELAAVPNSIFTCFRINGDSLVPQYLNYLFLGNLHGQWLRRFIEVGARAHGSLSIDDNDLLALPVPLPKGESSRREQQKIADCLSSVDELISAQTKKVDILKKYKQGLMQQLFPREGENKPRLRFPEFHTAREWKYESLGQMGSFIRGITYAPSDVSTTGLLVLRSGNIQDGVLVFGRDLVFVDKACDPDLLLRVGDIVVCMSNGSKALVGKSAEYLHGYSGKVTIGAFCSLFRPQKPFSRVVFQSVQYSAFVAGSIRGGNINNLKNSTLESFQFPIPPTLPEQQKVLDCLSSLNDLIGAQAHKLEALKTHKKGLMQQLFPSLGEVVA